MDPLASRDESLSTHASQGQPGRPASPPTRVAARHEPDSHERNSHERNSHERDSHERNPDDRDPDDRDADERDADGRDADDRDTGEPKTDDARARGLFIAHRPIALAYRIAALLVVTAGIVRIAGLLTAEPVWSSFLYFTVQSNVLCLVWFAVLVACTTRDLRRIGSHGASTPSSRWAGAIMMAITVTMLVYLVVLVPASFEQSGDYELFSLTDNLIHIITPCLVILDWLVFTPKGTFRWHDPVLWALIPYAYLVFAFIYGGMGGEFAPGKTFPYPFMDVERLGVGGVAVRIAVLTVSLIAVGYVYVVLDRLMGRRRAVP